MERICRKLLENMEQRLDEGALLEIKDYKAVTGALKELKELGQAELKKETALQVRFEGDAEALAK